MAEIFNSSIIDQARAQFKQSQYSLDEASQVEELVPLISPSDINKIQIGGLPVIPESQRFEAQGYIHESLERFILLMESHGNRLSPDDTTDAKLLMTAMVYGVLADEDERFRLTMPLRTGFGKTTAVKALMLTLAKTNYSLAVATETLAEHKALYDELLDLGIPLDKVGIFHSTNRADIKSIKSEDITYTQFLLVTHQRVKGTNVNYDDFLGDKRRLIIWDEVLQANSGSFVSAERLIEDISGFLGRAEYMQREQGRSSRSPLEYESFLQFLGQYKASILNALDSNVDTVINIPELPVELQKARQFAAGSESPQLLNELLKWSSQNDRATRLVKVSGNGRAILKWHVAVPDEVNKIINLDAGASVNRLLALDKDLKRLPVCGKKDYSAVTVNRLNVYSSRSALENDLDDYIKEVVGIIGGIPLDQDVLILGFKDGKVKMKDKLYAALGKTLGDTSRLHYLSYGAHKAVNNFSHVKYVITFGILYRDINDMAAQLVAQQRDISAPVTQRQAEEARASEMAQLLYQALSRGSCRRTIDGISAEMNVWLMLPNKDELVIDILKRQFTGATFLHTDTTFLASLNDGREDLIRRLNEYLGELPLKTNKISIKKLKDAVAPKVSKESQSWRFAVMELKNQNVNWVVQDRSLVRRESLEDKRYNF